MSREYTVSLEYFLDYKDPPKQLFVVACRASSGIQYFSKQRNLKSKTVREYVFTYDFASSHFYSSASGAVAMCSELCKRFNTDGFAVFSFKLGRLIHYQSKEQLD